MVLCYIETQFNFGKENMMSKLTGVFQIVIGCGVLAAAVGAYFANHDVKQNECQQEIMSSIYRIEEICQQNNRDMQGLIHVQKKVANVVSGSVELVAKGVDATISLKDYKVMNTKPFTFLEKTFSGVQKDVHSFLKKTQKLENDLDAIQKRIDTQAQAVNEFKQALAKNNDAKQTQETGTLLLLAALALAGVGFVINGGTICYCAGKNDPADVK